MTPRMERRSIGPGEAAQLLGRNTHNRKLGISVVRKYAADMAAGRWRGLTAEPLAIDSDGVLQDGQHRLHAIVASGVTVDFWVLLDADPQDYDVIGQGKVRTIGDVVGMDGIASAADIASAARIMLLLSEHGNETWSGNIPITRGLLLATVRRHRDMLGHAVRESTQLRPLGMPRVQYAAVMALAIDGHPSGLWDEFHAKVRDGINLDRGDPALALRDWAIGFRAGRRGRLSSGGSSAQQLKTAVIAKAWNAYAEDRPVRLLRWRREELPMPHPLPSTEAP